MWGNDCFNILDLGNLGLITSRYGSIFWRIPIMTKKDKLQHLIITSLLKDGQIEVQLPDGITLQVGITKEGKDGQKVKDPGYCWVNTCQDDRTAFIDTYNLSLRYPDHDNIIFVDHDEEERSRLAVV